MPKSPKLLSQLVSQDPTGDYELINLFEVLLRQHYRFGTCVSGVAVSITGSDHLCAAYLPFRFRDEPNSLDGSQVETDIEHLLRFLDDDRRKGFEGNLYLVDPTRKGTEAVGKDNPFGPIVARLKQVLPNAKPIEWNSDKLCELICEIPALGIRYYPELIPHGKERGRAIAATRKQHDAQFKLRHDKIQFVGMSVYKEEATTSVELDKIYIPLRVVPEDTIDEASATRTNPVELLRPGDRHVVLGDPGSGKSTLLRFLALAGTHGRLQKRFNIESDQRLPVLVILRRLADELKADRNLNLLDYIKRTTSSDLDVAGIDREFLEYYLYAGKAILLFDGVDELPGAFKTDVRDRIAKFLQDYPENTCIVTSRIVGYDKQFRYEDAGFAHHRVAKLTGTDIEEFVANWYSTRIASPVERRQHVEDLARIMQNAESRAIRDLAENPLLLTIVCLVHRIDAVLPDERVVLYQKCTETLLNTWHNWKFRTADQGNRGEIEARNRARIEAIAFWLQCTFDEVAEAKRAVAAEADLKEFLTDYIIEVEELEEDAEQLSDEFLRFIRERAGLLIEVGDKQYSFVHLTFQEYLTATYLKKSGEVPGVEFIWSRITYENRLANSRWHEVIRLLVASMDHPAARKYFMEQIVPDDADADFFPRSLLAAGCLVDGIDAARKMEDAIIANIVRAGAIAADLDQLRRPLALLRNWQERGPDARRQVAAQTASVCDREADLCMASALNLASLGWSYDAIRQALPTNFKSTTPQRTHFGILFKQNGAQPLSPDEDQSLSALSCWVCAETAGGNLLSLVLSSLVYDSGRQPSPKLECLLFLFRYNLAILSFYQLPLATLLCIGSLAEDEQPGGLDQIVSSGIQAIREWLPVRERVRQLEWAQFQVLDRVLGHVLARDSKQIEERDWARARVSGRRDADQDIVLDRVLKQELGSIGRLHRDWCREQVLNQAPDRLLDRLPDGTYKLADIRLAWQELLGESTAAQQLLHSFIESLQLNPKAQWYEALRVRIMPRIPERITIANPQVWQRTLTAFENDQANELDCRHAATHLLLDTWLYLVEHHSSKEESPFARLAELTKDSDNAALRVVHCIRDLAYGDEKRESDFRAMIESDEPAMRTLLVNSFWRDP